MFYEVECALEPDHMQSEWVANEYVDIFCQETMNRTAAMVI